MQKKNLEFLSNFLCLHKISDIFLSTIKRKVIIYNNYGSYLLLILLKEFIQNQCSILYISLNKEESLHILHQVENILGKEVVLYFSDFDNLFKKKNKEDNFKFIYLFQILNKIHNNLKKYFIISYVSVLTCKVFSFDCCVKKSYKIFVNQIISLESLHQILLSLKFNQVDFVYSPGEYSIRGNILDIFSFSNINPFRILFVKNKIKEIKKINIKNQRSLEILQSCSIINYFQFYQSFLEEKKSFFNYLSNNCIIIFNDFDEIIKKYYVDFIKKKDVDFDNQLCNLVSKNEFIKDVNRFKILNIVKKKILSNNYFNIFLGLSVKPLDNFNKNFNLLFNNLQMYFLQGYKIFISIEYEYQKQYIIEEFNNINKNILDICRFIQLTVYQGFIDKENKLVLYTYYQILNKNIEFNTSYSYPAFYKYFEEQNNLKIGDYVTHIDYGIGKFLGLKKIKVASKIQEAIKIAFLNDDILYVSIHSLYKISLLKINDNVPKLSKLGSSKWKNIKDKVKKKIKHIAFDLIKLYAQRKQIKGFSFLSNDNLNSKLEKSFQYEDTKDQIRANLDVKKDMESNIPMDRLICGDVGFGKTEIAIRAAFQAVYNFKQVVVLVPTTILAFQHYKSFLERLKKFSICIDYLNRFRTNKEKSQIIKNLKNGKINIIIGTHQLISKNIIYKDLGLLIIDEEHKFGVSVKDKLKLMKSNLDTLTLTATPIPRTLQFSLNSARDLSIINTPPKNRKSICTVVKEFNQELIKDIITHELSRNGQIFFVNHRIQGLSNITKMIQSLIPEVKIRSVHGQMLGTELEKIFLDFIEGKFNVLVSTMIVECGLDIPNVNTIIINNAQFFGMADLHQLRGRVGRSNIQSFCYLIIPNFNSLTKEAKIRLESMEKFSKLGSGFSIAIKDLEIRGAGNLLGAEQSGFISNIGFDTYQKILNNTIEELKNSEFLDVFKNEINNKNIINNVQIETDFELFIPDNYIHKVEERLLFYKRLSQIENEEQLEDIKLELLDRFGVLPDSVKSLLKLVKVKLICQEIGFKKLIIKDTVLLAFFPECNVKYFQNTIFTKVLDFIKKFPDDTIYLKNKIINEKKTILYLKKENIFILKDLYIFFNKIYHFCINKK